MIKITKKLINDGFLNFFEAVFISTVVFFIVYVFIGQIMVITGDSMYPTYINGEKLIVEKLSVKYKPLSRDEIVIFNHPLEKIVVIKRVIGLPGEKVMISDNKVYINGQPLEEPYLQPNTQTQSGQNLKDGVEYEIPADSYVVLGDNRKDSLDSRQWGFLPKQYIVGRIFVKF